MFSAISDLIGNSLVGVFGKHVKRRFTFKLCLTTLILISIAFYYIKIPSECSSNDNDYCW